MVMAIIAGGTALGVAGVVTLAAWNDNEWVFGGTGPGGEDGVGTSSFNVEQNAWSGTVPTADFDDFETNPESNALKFDVDPTGLTPGDTIYAPVAMRTAADSIGGELQLLKPVAAEVPGMTANDTDGLLWEALRYSVRVTTSSTDAANCTPSGFANAGADLVPANTAFATDVPEVPQTLLADSGDIQYYCFAITLPDSEASNKALQDRTVFPAWEFFAKSD